MSGKQPIERIPLVAPVPSILTSVRPLPAVNWSTGVAWTPTCGAPSGNWPRCPEPDTEKAAGAPNEPVATDAFTIYTPIECAWVTSEGGDRLTTIASEATEVHTAWGIARALWLGEGLPTVADENYGLPPTLRRNATDVSIGGFAAALDDVVATLLSAYERCTFGAGGAVLHIPTVLIPGALGGGGGGARVCWPEGNLYRGPAGSVVSPGPGYPYGQSAAGAGGFGPLVSSDPEVYKGNGYDEVWVYISGPVEYAVGPIVTLPEEDAMRRVPFQMNQYEVIAERPAIVRFDPCCVFAAKAINDSGERS